MTIDLERYKPYAPYAAIAVVILALAVALVMGLRGQGESEHARFTILCTAPGCGEVFTLSRAAIRDHPRDRGGFRCQACGKFAGRSAIRCVQCGEWYPAETAGGCPKCAPVDARPATDMRRGS
jgi:hypothetical protein